ncbi:arylsulfotransferase [Penicillium atrosanguineum]|nr:arylsulfotransferase [Penicillium atrosanguineum]
MFQPTGDVAWEYVNPVESQRLSKTAWALLGTGLGVLFLAGVTVGVIVWHRGNNYNRLGADDFVLGDDFDLDSVVSEGSNDDGEDVDRAANVDPQSRTAEDSRALLQNAEK